MQIQGTPSAMMYPARLTQRPVSNPASTVPPGASTPAAQGGPAQQQIDVAKILEHWGTSNAEADLNTDGIVDAQDLALASAQQNSGVGGVASGWGQSGVSDLNGDGITDATDLAMALHEQSPNAPETRQAVVTNLVDAAFQARDKDNDGSLAARDFADNGRIFKKLDIDESGRVGRDELTKALTAQLDRFMNQVPNAQPSAFAKRWLEAFTGTRPAPDLGNFTRVQELFAKGPTATRGVGILSARA